MPIHTDELSPPPGAVDDGTNLGPVPTIHPYDSTANQLLDGFDPHNEQTSINIANMINVHDMIQPIAPAQGLASFNEQTSGNMENTVNVHDMLQPITPMQNCASINGQASVNTNMVNVHETIHPILQAQAFATFNKQNRGNMGNMVNVHDMLQPILPMQNCASIHGQATMNSSVVNVHDMIQPILPAQVCERMDAQPQTDIANIVGSRDINQPRIPTQASTLPDSRSNAMGTAGVHDVFQSTSPFQETRPVDRQAPVIYDRLFVPMTANPNDTHNQNPFNSPVIQPVHVV